LIRGVVRTALSSLSRTMRVLRRVPLVGVTRGFGDAERRLALLVDLFSDATVFLGGSFEPGCFDAGAFPEVVGRFEGLEDEGVGWVEVAWPLVDAYLFRGGLDCWPCKALRVILLSPLCSSRGTVLMRPDFLRPPSVKVVGPSATTFFHGGDSILAFRVAECGVVSRTRRRFAGGSSSWFLRFGEVSWPALSGGSFLTGVGSLGFCFVLLSVRSMDSVFHCDAPGVCDVWPGWLSPGSFSVSFFWSLAPGFTTVGAGDAVSVIVTVTRQSGTGPESRRNWHRIQQK
jgi:hypothetical protein